MVKITYLATVHLKDQQPHDRLVYLSKKTLDLLPVSRIQKGQFITSKNLVWKKNVAFLLIF